MVPIMYIPLYEIVLENINRQCTVTAIRDDIYFETDNVNDMTRMRVNFQWD